MLCTHRNRTRALRLACFFCNPFSPAELFLRAYSIQLSLSLFPELVRQCFRSARGDGNPPTTNECERKLLFAPRSSVHEWALFFTRARQAIVELFRVYDGGELPVLLGVVEVQVDMDVKRV